MKYQAVFTRYELKYLLTIEQKKQITDAMAPYMALDAFGRTTIGGVGNTGSLVWGALAGGSAAAYALGK